MKRIILAVRDENRSVHQRLFIFLGTLALVAMFCVFLIELLLGGNRELVFALGGGILLLLLMVLLGYRKDRMNPAAIAIALIAILLILPLIFFTSGGIYGGAPVWFVFCTLFVTLIVYGRVKYILLVLETVTAGICYSLAYSNPDLVLDGGLTNIYIGSYISVVLVSLMLCIMVGFEIHMLKRETVRSNEKSRQIEALSQAQNRFFSSMSHEIRTPINTIIGLNEMTLRENPSEEIAENARNIQSASGVLLSLINDILDMSKMSSGKMEIVPVTYDVGKMLSDIVNMIAVTAEQKGLAFMTDVDPTLPSQLYCDEVRLKQILINLLNNAVKYTKAGSVSLSVHWRRNAENAAVVTYSVADTGIGIRKESIPHLFDAFTRLDVAENRYIEGTGLGLSIVRQLVDLLGGEISVSSIYTQGSTFAVTVTQEIAGEQELGAFRAERYQSAASAEKRAGHFEAPNARVLIVDDNSTNLLVVQKLLRRTRMQTDTAESGAQCLEMTLKAHYDAILMDHMMPGMDGVTCLHAVREQTAGLCRETPVAVLTANAGSEDQALYHREGFDAYLMKPVDADLLEETLLNLLPPELVTRKDANAERYESGELIRAAQRKAPLVITADSVSDLPRELRAKYRIAVIPYRICTEHGVFEDGLETDGDVLLRAVTEDGLLAESRCPTVAEYEEFFAQQLAGARQIIHIAMAKRASRGFANASEAALAFYNVSVVDSGHLSSGIGLMALDTAVRLHEEPFVTAEELTARCAELRGRIQTSFLLDDTEYLNRSGRLSDRINRLCRAFMIRPMMELRESGMKVGRLFFGSRRRARRRYIRYALRSPQTVCTDRLFITYAGMRQEEAEELRDAVQEILRFDQVLLQKASPAVAANCGAGTFGLIFERKQHG